MRRITSPFLAVFLLLAALPACFTSVTVPQAPGQAVYVITIDDVGDVVQPAANGKNSGFGMAVRIQETAGLGGHVNFFLLEVLLDGALVESDDVSGSFFVPGNRIPPFGDVVFALGFGFNADPAAFNETRLVVNLTDDGGTVHDIITPFTLTF